ncbi:MAG: diacylglycerol kinase family protein [Pseudomonadota bacterium]
MTQNPVFVVNPKSHRVNTSGSVLSKIAVDYGDIPVVYFDGSTSLSETLTPLLLQGKDTIYAEGGDGTVVAALTSSIEALSQGGKLPQIGILPGGSTNLTYHQLGLKTIDPESLKRIINTGKAERIATHQALLVRTSEMSTPNVGFLLSTGSLARLMIYTQENLHGRTRGAVSIIRAILQLVLFARSTKFSDGLPVVRASQFSTCAKSTARTSIDETFSVFSTFRELSLGLSPFWGRGDHQIGHTQAVWPIRQMRLGILKALFRGAGENLIPHGLTSRGCSGITFRSNGPVMLDGEDLPMPRDGTFEVSVSPELEFIR